jgi:hypothetical protein
MDFLDLTLRLGHRHPAVGLSDAPDNPQRPRVVPWGEVAAFVGRSDATRSYPVGRSDESTS